MEQDNTVTTGIASPQEKPTGVAVDIAVGETIENKHSNELKATNEKIAALEKQLELFSKQPVSATPPPNTGGIEESKLKVEAPAAPEAPISQPAANDWKSLNERIEKINNEFNARLKRIEEQKLIEDANKKLDDLTQKINLLTSRVKPEARHSLPQREGVPVGAQKVYWDGHRLVPLNNPQSI